MSCCSGAICDDTSPPFIVRCMAGVGVRTSCNIASIHSQLPVVTRTYHSPSALCRSRSQEPSSRVTNCCLALQLTDRTAHSSNGWEVLQSSAWQYDRLWWLRNVKLEIWMIWSIVSFVWSTVLLITKVWSSEMAGCGRWCSCLCSRPAPLRPSIVADPFVMPIQTPAPPGSPCQCTN